MRLRGAILQAVVNVVDHGLGVEEAITAPRVHLDEPDVHCEGGLEPAELDRLEQQGYDVVRWRRRNLYFGGVSAVGGRRRRLARGRRRPARRGRVTGSSSSPAWAARSVRPASAGRSPRWTRAALVALAEAVGSEPEGWLISDRRWRSAADERRYLRAVRRHPDAAVFVAETAGGIVGRLSLARDPHPASRHVADLGLMVAASARRRGIGWALLEQAVEWARGAGVTKLELHVFPHNEPAIRLYERFGFVREGCRQRQYRRGRGLRRRDPDGLRGRRAAGS